MTSMSPKVMTYLLLMVVGAALAAWWIVATEPSPLLKGLGIFATLLMIGTSAVGLARS